MKNLRKKLIFPLLFAETRQGASLHAAISCACVYSKFMCICNKKHRSDGGDGGLNDRVERLIPVRGCLSVWKLPRHFAYNGAVGGVGAHNINPCSEMGDVNNGVVTFHLDGLQQLARDVVNLHVPYCTFPVNNDLSVTNVHLQVAHNHVLHTYDGGENGGYGTVTDKMQHVRIDGIPVVPMRKPVAVVGNGLDDGGGVRTPYVAAVLRNDGCRAPSAFISGDVQLKIHTPFQIIMGTIGGVPKQGVIVHASTGNGENVGV